MTPQPERCGHYDACWFVHIWRRCPNDEPTEYETDLPDCELDTRSRPAPSLTESEITNKILRMAESDEWQKEHDATIRNQTLDAFVKRVRQEFTQDDDEEWYLSAYDFEDCIDEFKNSDGDGDE